MMSKLIPLLVFFLWPFFVHSQDKSTVIRSVTVIDMVNGNLQANMTVVITNNKITAVSKKAKAPQNATIIDARGK
jgi:imidazolonepropionase-like amidohydrolase